MFASPSHPDRPPVRPSDEPRMPAPFAYPIELPYILIVVAVDQDLTDRNRTSLTEAFLARTTGLFD